MLVPLEHARRFQMLVVPWSEADINALLALAPLPRGPFPAHHAPSLARRHPLEPQAQP
jgi:hypothetical protein